MCEKEEKTIRIEYSVKCPNDKIFYCNGKKITCTEYKQLKKANKKGFLWASKGDYYCVINNGIIKHIITLHPYNIITKKFCNNYLN